ncbi:amidohydrolase family protein [candidate division CSSED10-310 bacterium]|uniref:Amidohydrolase family protein n=1 Tax=candidate division CSSED10-310 bacterium TaxID=2855610 RepID=A0ABV6YY36_UNCC1
MFSETNSQATTSLYFSNIDVIDVTTGAVKPEMLVGICGNRITALGKKGEIQPSHDARVINGSGKFLIPGLWDMHVHWYYRDYLPLFIVNGVTGIRQMWGVSEHQQWCREMEQGSLACPRMEIGSEIVDGPKPVWPGSIRASNAAEARQVVRLVKKHGFDFVKIYAHLPREAFFALADEAHKINIPYAGHIPQAVTASEASRARQKSIEHMDGILRSCSSQEEGLRQRMLSALEEQNYREATRNAGRKNLKITLETQDKAKTTELIKCFAQNITWQCPTFTVSRNMAWSGDPIISDDPRINYMPRAIRSLWKPATDFRLNTRTEEDATLFKRAHQLRLDMVPQMLQAGVPFLAGTDTLNPFCFPGFSLHDEFELLYEAGLSPLQVVQSATLNAALYRGTLASEGTIEVGKVADLVVLEANPLESVSNTRKIQGVVLNGRYFTRDDLITMKRNIAVLAQKKSVAEELLPIITESGISPAIAHYHQLKTTSPDDYEFGPDELNAIGQQLMNLNKNDEAIRIFKLNLENYPEHWESYDNLAEAYTSNKDFGLARENFRNSLKYNPHNIHAIQMLEIM